MTGNSESGGAIKEKEDENKKESSKADESELRLAQLQHQLPANEPGTLMHLVEESTAVDTDDDETKECKSLFKNLKFYLSREVCYWNLALLQANYLVIDQLSVFYSDKFSYFKILHSLQGA